MTASVITQAIPCLFARLSVCVPRFARRIRLPVWAAMNSSFCLKTWPGGRRDEAIEIAQRILEKFQHPFMISGNECVVSASVGVAIASHGTPLDAASLLRDADVAMYRAKRSGKHRFAIFEASMNAGSLSRLRLEADLRHAIARDELRLHFQLDRPFVDAADSRHGGAAALAASNARAVAAGRIHSYR